MIADLATGVGKTFLMSSLIEYLATQGVRHVHVSLSHDAGIASAVVVLES